jgi:hypothetical protein
LRHRQCWLTCKHDQGGRGVSHKEVHALLEATQGCAVPSRQAHQGRFVLLVPLVCLCVRQGVPREEER